jgi:bifunctional non-homologous end joining protein LigD
MTLKEYRRKRDFRKTREPAGSKRKGTGRLFVVQKHDASRLHYDFRLELDGVLKSWAVPKGPSPDAKGKSLAVEVEDHPLDYGDFEGTIPAGEYGGGTVMVWDTGTWEPEGDAAGGLRQGKLNFTLHGQKLGGQWTLVRMADRERDRGRHNWLLIHRQGEQPRISKRDRDRSVMSGRTMEEIAEAGDRVWRSDRPARSKRRAQGTRAKVRAAPRAKRPSADLSGLPGARQRPLPAAIEPQLATLVAEAPAGREWLHEFKYDGYRILARIDGSRIDLLTRRGNNWTRRFPAAVAALAALGLTSAILDGEMVALDEHGATNFQLLQNWLQRGDDRSLVFYLFDVPYLDGYDLCRVPLSERKRLLAELLGTSGANDGLLRYSDHLRGQGAKVVEYACRSGMEGVVSKRADSHYAFGRSRSWLKIKCLQREEFVIGGYTQPAGSRQGFGSLLLGYHKNGKLRYAGRVGTGFTQQSLADLARRLKSLRVAKPPFENPPPSTPRQRATWVRPELVAEVAFSGWTDDGVLRHPAFRGLRED